MNPCPCGFAGDPRRSCACDPRERSRYARKLSGPFLDRIDLHVVMRDLPWPELRSSAVAEPSAAIRARVEAARVCAASRRPGRAGFRNGDLTAQELVQHCPLDGAGARVLETAVGRLHLSARAIHRALRVARTIADLAKSERVLSSHLSEALSFRPTTTSPISCPIEQG